MDFVLLDSATQSGSKALLKAAFKFFQTDVCTSGGNLYKPVCKVVLGNPFREFPRDTISGRDRR